MGYKIIQPTYVNKFSCIGPACEATCCAGWNVTVDRETYMKYKKLPMSPLKKKLEENIKRNRTSTSGNTFAQFKLDTHHQCPLLGEDMLCEVHKQLGEQALSHTCSIYPRAQNKLRSAYEISSTPSCPEVVRLLVDEVDGLQFEESERDHLFKFSNHFDKSQVPEQTFWDIRVFSIQLIQMRTIPLHTRLIILGLFYQAIDEDIADSKHVEQTIESFTIKVNTPEYVQALMNIQGNKEMLMQYVINILDVAQQKSAKRTKMFELVAEIAPILNNLHINIVNEIDQRAMRHEREYPHLYENYLVNHLFYNVMPLNQKTAVESYQQMISSYIVMRNLVEYVAYVRNQSIADVFVEVVYAFEREIEHNASFKKLTVAIIEDMEINQLPHLIQLLNS
ncbi:flagellin lysine-N-methylase [Savagea sp. SN6]|uniref:Flagellin lysine-N-methylase n=1 Tax=Savagea serpentis TaxID=2785297 RepID=A0A8J7GCP9_9BACL|nr:flagellin lysine-N-methylase [Savagea serpentis]MBF4501291.1 flagellin lysine-N-methylase [Savagea serpentis]